MRWRKQPIDLPFNLEHAEFKINSNTSAVDCASDVIKPEMARVLAAKTASERLRIGWGMWRSARMMVERIVAAENPELSPVEWQTIIARRMSHGT